MGAHIKQGLCPKRGFHEVAQFLTFDGRVVAEQSGRDGIVRVRYRGRKEFVSVPAAEWKEKTRFEYFDANKVPRATALDLYEAAQNHRRVQ
jgi:hypothetical protein